MLANCVRWRPDLLFVNECSSQALAGNTCCLAFFAAFIQGRERPLEHAPEPSGVEAEEGLFDREWARQVMELSMDRLRSRYAKEQQDLVFETLSPALTGDLPQHRNISSFERL